MKSVSVVIIHFLLSIMLGCLFSDEAWAQNDIRVVTQVLPPYSPYFSDYTSKENRIVLLITSNRRDVTQEVRLGAQVSSNNGVSMLLDPNYIPPAPIVVGPLQTVRITGAALRDYLDLDFWQINGILESEIVQGNGLPEGNYQLCVQALEYQSGRQLSMGEPMGCAIFNITSLEPPFILQPYCGQQVDAINPQNILFSWSIPAGVSPAEVEYMLEVQEIFNEMDPNQLMLALPEPPFFRKTVQNNVYLYGLADPPLELGRDYAFRVTALSKGGIIDPSTGQQRSLNFRNEGRSEVCYFTYGVEDTSSLPPPVEVKLVDTSEKPKQIDLYEFDVDQTEVVDVGLGLVLPPVNQQPVNEQLDPEDSPDCISDCEVTMPGNNSMISAQSLAPGDEIQVGKYMMELTTVNWTGNGFNGTGTIVLPFLNTPVSVEFNNIRINTDLQVFHNSSKVTAVVDGGLPDNQNYLDQPMDDPGISSEQLKNAIDFVNAQNRKTSTFPQNNQNSIGLPFVHDNGANQLMVVGLIFTPTQAHVNLVAGFELSQAMQANQYAIFSGTFCIRPNGFGAAGALQLANNLEFDLSANVTHEIKQGSEIEFDCDGIQNIHLEGTLEFSRDLLLPLDNSGEVMGGNETVKANYTTDISDFHDWTLNLGSLSHPFTVPALVGFHLDASNITLDQSSSTTPNGAGKPSGWQGLYIGDLTVKLPDFFQKNNDDIELEVEDFTLDKTGFTGDIGPINDLISLEEGSLSSWPFSVDNFNIAISNSGLNGSSINGKIKIPISSTELDYDLLLSASENPEDMVDFQFSVGSVDELEIDMWFASLNLEESSTIGVEKEGNTYKPIAVLNGEVEFGWSENDGNKPQENNSVSSFTIPQIAFEELTVSVGNDNKPDVDFQFIGLDNDDPLAQGTIAGFTLQLNDIGFVKDNVKGLGVTFDIEAVLNEAANSIGGGTVFTIYGDLDQGAYKYNKTELNAIWIDVDIAVAKITGEVVIYQKDQVYGNGFRGYIDITINAIGVGAKATMQLGNVNNYRYWYFDVFFDFGVVGINIPPTMASIYGMGGGAWYNMNRESMQAMNVDDLQDDQGYDPENMTPGTNKYGVNITPLKGSHGFSAAIAYGITGAKTMFNGDLTFAMQILEGGGVESVTMEGNGYVMQQMNERDGAFIQGSLYISIEPRLFNADNAALNRPNMQLIASLDINIANILTGGGTLDMYFSPSEWWIKVGKWTNEDEPWNDDARVKLEIGGDLNIIDVTFHTYFMAGSDIPGIPNLPKKVRDMFNDKGMSASSGERDLVLQTNNPEEALGKTPGLALGAGSRFAVDVEFLIFYAYFEFINGFDVTLRKYEESPCGGTIGFKNWYAKGQAYAYLDFDIGVVLDIWVWKGKASILKAEAAAYIQAALPNPTWLKGQFAFQGSVLNGAIKFNTSFKFEMGKKCESGTPGPFGEFPIVADVIPEDNAEEVHVHTTPEIAFNFPEGPFEYTEEVDDELVERSYKYVLKSFKLEWNDAETNKKKYMELSGYSKYRGDGYSAVYYNEDFIFPENTDVKYTIVTEGWRVSGPDEKVYDETKTGSFTSGSWPSTIPKSEVVYGRPALRENYFLTDEFNNGWLRLKHQHSNLDDAEWWYENKFKLGNYTGTMSSGSFDFEARFIDQETDQVITKKFTANNEPYIKFAIPQNLEKERVYELSLVVVFTPPINSLAINQGNTQETYKDILINGPKINGIQAAQDLVFNPDPGDDPGNGGNVNQLMTPQQNANNKNQGMMMANANLVVQNAQAQQQQQPMLLQAQAVEPDPNPQVNQVLAQNAPDDQGGDVFIPQNPVYVKSLNFAAVPNNKVYIQRRHRELLDSKTGENKFEFVIFENFRYYFKTSKFGTLAQKLNTLKVDDVVEAGFTSQVSNYNQGDFVQGENNSNESHENINTQLPVIVIEVEENFDEHQAVSGKVLVAPENYYTISPIITFQKERPYDSWGYDKDFWGDGTTEMKIYKLPDDDDWAYLEYYPDFEDSWYGDHYDQIGFPYPPDDYWQFITPEVSGSPWSESRYKNNSNFVPFGYRTYPDVFNQISHEMVALKDFYTSKKYGGSVNFNGKTVGFTQQPLGYNPPPDDDDNGFDGPAFQLNMGNTNPVNPYAINNTQLQIIPPTQYIAVIDYSEWLAMRDWYLMKKYVYEKNEEEENDIQQGCTEGDKNLPGNFGANCYFSSVKNVINNHVHYQPRGAGNYFFTIQKNKTNTDVKKELEYEVSGVLND